MKVLMHTCCAPCSLSCTDSLKAEGLEVTAYWYNPNIHPWTEYVARRDCLISYAESISLPLIVDEDYGLREFARAVSDDIGGRCSYCYASRLEETAKAAIDGGFDAFTTTLLASPYQNRDKIIALGEELGKKYGVEFLPRDFRPNFREGNARAKELGLYMQKYCGCIFSEEDRYLKKINADRERFAQNK
ncbi:MAG: epoxyqueuosine reductase QueH [Clostridia bacterium]|nr:epoxyqueuosine reductase QueH [Clostridia bacterium]